MLQNPIIYGCHLGYGRLKSTQSINMGNITMTVKTLGSQKNISNKLPFAMFFAGEPAFTSIPKELLDQELCYNPILQINNETQLNMIVGGQTSTSMKRSTNTGTFGMDSDDDTMGDESQ